MREQAQEVVVEAQGSLQLLLEGSAEQRKLLADPELPLAELVQGFCDDLGLLEGDCRCVLVQGRSPLGPLVTNEAQLRGPLGLWRLSELVAERLEPLLEVAEGASVSGHLQGLLASFVEPRFAPELIAQDGFAVLLQVALVSDEAAGIAAKCLCELCRQDEARGWLEKGAELLSKELFQRLLAVLFPQGSQLTEEGEALPGGSSPRSAQRAVLCVCLFFLKEAPQQAGPAVHRAAAQVGWPLEPGYLRMARALSGEDLFAADAALSLLYALESAADGHKQLKSQVREELKAALSVAGEWRPRSVQWMFADAVKNRLAWSRWKGLDECIAELIGFGKKPEFKRPLRMKVQGARQTGEEEVRPLMAKNMSEAIDQLTEMFAAAKQTEERGSRRTKLRRQHEELPPGRDGHILRHFVAANMEVVARQRDEVLPPRRRSLGGPEKPQRGQEDLDVMKAEIRRQHAALCKMASFVQVEGHPEVQRRLGEVVRGGWGSVTWDGNHSLLHEVARRVDDPGLVELVALLAGDVERRDDAGKRPLDYARERQGGGAVASLLERLAAPEGYRSPRRRASPELPEAAVAEGRSQACASPAVGSAASPVIEAAPPPAAEPEPVLELGDAPTSSPRFLEAAPRRQASPPRLAQPEAGSAGVRGRSVRELGFGELRAELERVREELERLQAETSFPEESTTENVLGGPIQDVDLRRFALQVQEVGREEVWTMLQRPSFAGGLGLCEADAAKALRQLDVTLHVMQAMSAAAPSVAAPESGAPREAAELQAEAAEAAPEAAPQREAAPAPEDDAAKSEECSQPDKPEEQRPTSPPPPKVGGKAAEAKGEGKGKGKAPAAASPAPPPAKGGKAGGKGGKGPPMKGAPPAKAGLAARPSFLAEPTKPEMKLDTDLKPLHWKKLARTKGTIWADVGDDREHVPAEALTSWFRKVTATNKSRPSFVAQAGSNPICVITDARTKTSREISLRCLPPPAEVATALREVDASSLLPEDPEPGVQLESQLERVLAGVADQKQREELEAARAAEPDRPLGLIESYMWELGFIPACADRLKCWIYVHNVTERAESLSVRLRSFEEMLTCFRSSFLQRLLGLFLAVGNYLNAGTRDGRADGFDLDTFKKLDSVKDSQGRDIRHFVMGIFLKNFKTDAKGLLKDFGAVLKGVMRKVDSKGDCVELKKQVASLEGYTEDIKKFQEEFRAKKELLSKVLASIDDASDPFTVKMSEEFRRAGQSVEELVSLREKLVDSFGNVLDWFGALPKAGAFVSTFDAQMDKEAKGSDPTRSFPRSDDFILLWDNLLIPPELIERKPWLPDVKYKLGPRFCKAREITPEDLEDLWETAKMAVDGPGADEKPGAQIFKHVRRKSGAQPPAS